jgi:lysyl-tRNA synthetase class II
MDDTNSLIEQRKAKLAALRAKGIDPFKNKFTPGETCRHAREQYAEGREVALAGRITAHRDMGKSMFLDIRDQSGRMQIYAQKNVLGDEQFAIFQHLDLADFIGVKGTQFTTKTNEISVKITGFTILAKALRPPPAKWHGLEDTEIRYRQRYLDLMASKAAAPGTSTTGFEKGSPGDVLLLRSEIIREIRNFLHTRGYVEVETPMMQAIPGGAAAQPFKTHHNALGCEFYLRIALELYLKRLLVGGVDKVFEIGRNFRNEGLSRKHNPEFTMLEAYEAYGDYESMMELVEKMITQIAEKVFPERKMRFPRNRHGELRATLNSVLVNGRLSESILGLDSPDKILLNKAVSGFREHFFVKVISDAFHWELAKKTLPEVQQIHDLLTKNYQKSKGSLGESEVDIADAANALRAATDKIEELCAEEWIDLTQPWKIIKYKDLVREKAGADWFDISPAVRRQRAHDLGAEIGKEYEDFEVTGAVFEKLIEPTLIQPTFVTHLPKELVPLAKLSPDDPTTVEVFECCINGQEIAPAYTEQNDPIAQRERLEHQAGGEQQKLDEDFLVALEHGMPPAGGMGMGIDRLCMMLLGQESIRDVILFPQLKPK